ncbi:hypothetical protein ES702_06564 [subsurface metagenome]
MSRFTKSPATVQDFIEGANKTEEVERTTRTTRTRSSGKPWDGLDKKAASKNVFNLRFNDYYWAMLRHLAEKSDKPLQRVVKEILLPELEKRAKGG